MVHPQVLVITPSYNPSSTPDSTVPLVYTLQGGLWTASTLPLPAGAATVDLRYTTCPSAGVCFADGGYQDANTDLQGVLWNLDNAIWTAEEVPLPVNAVAPDEVIVANISCSSPEFCVSAAQNLTTSPGGNDEVVSTILVWSSGSWAEEAVPLPSSIAATDDFELESVSCTVDEFCGVVGTDTTADVSLLLTGVAGTWSTTTGPEPVGVASTSADEIDCVTNNYCTAEGGNFVDTDQIIYNLDAGTWTSEVSPGPPGATEPVTDADGEGLSCVSPDNCVIAANYQDAPFLELETGSSSAPLPDTQSLQVTVNPGTITMSTPYTSSNPFILPAMTLSADGTYLQSSATFPSATLPSSAQIVVTSSLAPAYAWSSRWRPRR